MSIAKNALRPMMLLVPKQSNFDHFSSTNCSAAAISQYVRPACVHYFQFSPSLSRTVCRPFAIRFVRSLSLLLLAQRAHVHLLIYYHFEQIFFIAFPTDTTKSPIYCFFFGLLYTTSAHQYQFSFPKSFTLHTVVANLLFLFLLWDWCFSSHSTVFDFFLQCRKIL